MGGIRNLLKNLRSWSLRRTFREDKVLSRFIARDIRRDVLIVSAARVDFRTERRSWIDLRESERRDK